MGAYKVHWLPAGARKVVCGRRRGDVITTQNPAQVTCDLCSLGLAVVTLVVSAKSAEVRT